MAFLKMYFYSRYIGRLRISEEKREIKPMQLEITWKKIDKNSKKEFMELEGKERLNYLLSTEKYSEK